MTGDIWLTCDLCTAIYSVARSNAKTPERFCSPDCEQRSLGIEASESFTVQVNGPVAPEPTGEICDSGGSQVCGMTAKDDTLGPFAHPETAHNAQQQNPQHGRSEALRLTKTDTQRNAPARAEEAPGIYEQRKGRKPKQESRAAEFRQALMRWKQTVWIPRRPSLRALARELGTSHQFLSYLDDGLEDWQYKERYRKAKKESEEISARAKAEGRSPWEDRETFRVMVRPALFKSLVEIRQDAKRGPLHRAQFKIVKMLAKQGFPGAQELLQKCSEVGLKKRKGFPQIVKETPRREGETLNDWVRRIWDECDKYETNCPTVITEELLQKLSQGSAKDRKNNLPAISTGAAKSFRTA